MTKKRQAIRLGLYALLLIVIVLAVYPLPSHAQAGPVTEGNAARDEAVLKNEWQSRILGAKRRLVAAEARLAELDQKKKDLMSQWGAAGAALPSQDVVDAVKQVEEERKTAAAAITSIRNEINTVIPEEARKAGIPPGWLREVQ